MFQNRFNPSANAIWTFGRHTITFGGSFEYTQLNTRDRRNQLGTIESEDINQFLQGTLTDDYLYAGTLFLCRKSQPLLASQRNGRIHSG